MLCAMSQELDKLSDEETFVVETSMGDTAEKLAKASLMNETGMPDDIAEEVIRQNGDRFVRLRQSAASLLDDIDHAESNIMDAAQNVIDNCPGQLKMRARTKAGRHVTTVVCASESAPSGFSCESAHIERT